MQILFLTNLIPTNIVSSEYITNLQNLAAQLPSVVRMQKLYEIAAPYIESKVIFNGARWDVRLSLSRKNYLHITEQYAKLDFGKDQFNDGGPVGGRFMMLPPIITNESVAPRELVEKYKTENLDKINQQIDALINTHITINPPKVVTYKTEQL